MRTRTFVFVLVGLLAVTGLAFAQNPSSTLSGRVTSESGALPGVTVTATSPALQGERSAVTTENGSFILPFLPPGEYQVSFALDGFATLEQSVRVPAGQQVQLSAEMSSATVTEEIQVTGSLENISVAPQAATTYEKSFIETLPIARDVRNTALLVPAVAATGPARNLSISGNMSFENLFMVNGVVITENLRGQPFDLFIEDAIQETTVSTSGVSAEYGRFAGGVVNTITRSGGNQYHGSFRTNLTNQKWVSQDRFTPSREDKNNPVYEATLGGYIVRDRLWHFLAARDLETDTRLFTATGVGIPAVPYQNADEQQRYEGKLTFALSDKHRLVGSYMEIDEIDGGNNFNNVSIDLNSILTRELPQELKAVNYTGVLTSNFFVEAQYSERNFSFINSGAPFTDRINGTLLVTSAGQRFWSATFCGVCGPEKRDNENILAKANYFLATDSMGSHDFAFGYDSFNDIRVANNHQSGSDFRVTATGVVSVNGTLFPRFLQGVSVIQFNPIAIDSKGTDFKTNSFYVNDRWALNNRLSFNLGVRYDQNDGSDAEGVKVVDDKKVSPRLGLSWDVKGDGDLVVNASAARYVAAIANNQADTQSKGGQPAQLRWFYNGPSINPVGAATLLPTAQALQQLFAWFDANGGINKVDFESNPVLPGLTARVDGTLASPHTDEFSIGAAKRFGANGLIRADIVHRESDDFYMTTNRPGQIVAIPGGRADLSILTNDDNLLKREYDGLHTQFRYRLADAWDLGGNYTLSRTKGNFDGETGANGPVSSALEQYKEYKSFAQHNPEGYLANDQRHRARVWLRWDALRGETNKLNISLLQNYATGTPYGAVATIRTNAFGLTNPGYAVVPATVNYYFTGRDEFRTDDITSTDISVNYSFNLKVGASNIELFLQPEVLNVFDEDGVEFFTAAASTQVLTNVNDTTLATFNPFTTTPVEGVHWRKGTSFGQATRTADLQTPRTIRFSVGVRF
jgi:outer membrane receptor protein involved in Fe transport